MPKRVIHHFLNDFDNAKEGQFLYTQCGQVFIAGPTPTEEQVSAIAEKTKNDAECKRCLAAMKKARKG